MAKAIIRLDVPDFQIGQKVSVFFQDTMLKKGICEPDEQVRCGDCARYKTYGYCSYNNHTVLNVNWYCADAKKKDSD